MHVWANFQRKVGYVDILVYSWRMCFPAFPANRDVTGIVIHAVLHEAILTIENSVAVHTRVKLTKSAVTIGNQSGSDEVFNRSVPGSGVHGGRAS